MGVYGGNINAKRCGGPQSMKCFHNRQGNVDGNIVSQLFFLLLGKVDVEALLRSSCISSLLAQAELQQHVSQIELRKQRDGFEVSPSVSESNA